jgi:signal transduction histidine kinase
VGRADARRGARIAEGGARLAAAVGALAARAGWAAFDVAAHEAGRSLFRLALHTAARAGDPDLRAHILVEVAAQHSYPGNPGYPEDGLEIIRMVESGGAKVARIRTACRSCTDRRSRRVRSVTVADGHGGPHERAYVAAGRHFRSYDRAVHGLLRSVWREPSPPDPPVRVWRDWVLVAVLVPVAVLEGVLTPDLEFRVLSVAVTAGLVPLLLWRRTHPLLMVAIWFTVSAMIPLLTGGRPIDMMAQGYSALLLYALFRWGSGRQMVIGSVISVVSHFGPVQMPRPSLSDIVLALAAGAAVAALAMALRYRARERARELDQVKLVERERLARDLHDTVAHHVSAIAIRAQAGLATAKTEPGAASDALRVIEAEASRTLAEMRSLVRMLRHSDNGESAGSASELQRLAGRERAGPQVDVRIAGDLDALPAPVGTALYRLAQESVTNARKHARHATRIEVRVDVDETNVRLQVSDDGDTAPSGPLGPPGYGLLGMRERAGLLGGTCEAGPNPDRGWTVTAVMPKAGSPA